MKKYKVSFTLEGEFTIELPDELFVDKDEWDIAHEIVESMGVDVPDRYGIVLSPDLWSDVNNIEEVT